MSHSGKQDIEVSGTSPKPKKKEKQKKELFDREYYAERREEERLQYLKERNSRAYYQEMERNKLRQRLYLEIKKFLDQSADVSLVEKNEILSLVKKFTEQELNSLMNKIIKEGLKEGIAQIKSQKKFLKGRGGND